MKKLLLSIFILIFSFSLSLLTSCNKPELDNGSNNTQDTPTLMDFSDLVLNNVEVFYDGDSHSLKLDGILPEGATVTYFNNDKVEVGTYNVSAKVECEGYNSLTLTATLTIKKVDYDMSNIKFESKTYTYDGVEKELLITGDLPEGVTVKYENNKLTDAGVVVAKANFISTNPNYNDIPSLTAVLTINKANYDMSAIKFESKTYTYDGVEKELLITGDLPEGVTVEYENNKLTDAGAVIAKANFISTNPNYNDIPSLTAILTINKANYNMSNIKFDSKTFTYDGTEKELLITGDLPEGVTVEYENNKLTNVGMVLAKAKFKSTNPNYNSIETLEAILLIEKGNYDMSNVKFNDMTFEYDGTLKTIEITGTLPQGLTVEYTNNTLTIPGDVTATAKFINTNPNYNDVPSMTAILTVTTNYNVVFKQLYDKLVLPNIDGFTILSDFSLPNKVEVGPHVGNIEWISNDLSLLTITKYKENYRTNIHPTSSPVGDLVTFVAEIDYFGNTINKKFSITIMDSKVNFDNYLNKKRGEQALIEGYISHIERYIDSYDLYVEDIADLGGYYCYRVDIADEAFFNSLTIGTHVRVIGEVSFYNSVIELRNATVTILEGRKDIIIENITSQLMYNAENNINNKSLYNRYVRIEDLYVYNLSGKTKKNRIQASLKTLNLNIYLKRGNPNYIHLLDIMDTLEVNDFINVEGFLQGTRFIITSVEKTEVVKHYTDAEIVEIKSNTINNIFSNIAVDDVSITLPQNKYGVTYEYKLDDPNNQYIYISGDTLHLLCPPADVITNNITITISYGSATNTLNFNLERKYYTTHKKYFLGFATIENVTGVITHVKLEERYSKPDVNDNVTILYYNYYVILQDENGAYYMKIRVNETNKIKLDGILMIGNKIHISSASNKTSSYNFNSLYINDSDVDNITLVSTNNPPILPFELTEKMIAHPTVKNTLCYQKVIVKGVLSIEGRTVYIQIGNTEIKYDWDRYISSGVEFNMLEQDINGNYINNGKSVEITGYLGYEGRLCIHPLDVDSIIIK